MFNGWHIFLLFSLCEFILNPLCLKTFWYTCKTYKTYFVIIGLMCNCLYIFKKHVNHFIQFQNSKNNV
jgi:type IV secretory pathway component VirB8